MIINTLVSCDRSVKLGTLVKETILSIFTWDFTCFHINFIIILLVECWCSVASDS